MQDEGGPDEASAAAPVKDSAPLPQSRCIVHRGWIDTISIMSGTLVLSQSMCSSPVLVSHTGLRAGMLRQELEQTVQNRSSRACCCAERTVEPD